jgi:sporulation protein YlmC with PRC-barrel domain
MLYEGKDLKRFDIQATDGSIGTVHDFFFDDQKWTARYLVVDTMKWLPGQKVLISPMSIGKVEAVAEEVALSLTKEQIKDSPTIDADKPVSKQNELVISDYYGFPPYWSGMERSFWGSYLYPAELYKNRERYVMDETYNGNSEDSHLRSMKEVSDYHVHATDGQIGHIEDFLIDEQTWAIRYLIVDTKNWWPGRKVLISPDWMNEVSWDEKTVYVDFTKEEIKNGPEYTKAKEVSRDFETSLYEKYNKIGYW